jgi:putative ABC transport system permease protein
MSLISDFRYAARRLRQSPGFTLVAVITLALGIGANSAIFRALDAVLLRPLPFEDPSRLVAVGPDRGSSYMEMLDWRQQGRAFDDVGLYSSANWPFDLTSGERPQRLQGAVVSPSFFEVLRARAAQGRTFTSQNGKPGGERLLVLSHGSWQRRFGGDRDIVGRAVTLNGQAYTVAGVMPAGFEFPNPSVELWSLLTVEIPIAATEDGRGAHAFLGFARLPPGVSIEAAQAEMDVISRRLERLYPEESSGPPWKLQPLQAALATEVRPALLLLLGAVGFLLLIACANVGNLLLVRATVRQKDIAVRRALGAGRKHIVRQLLAESLLLALLGGLLGVLFAVWAGDVLPGLAPDTLYRAREGGFDVRVVAFSTLLSLVTGLLFGLAPALHASGIGVGAALQQASRGLAGGIRGSRVRSALVVAEVALALALLTGAGLLMRSLWELLRVDTGFNSRNLLTFQISLPELRYPEPTEQAAFFRDVLDRIEGLPGVESAGAVGDLPLIDDFYAPHDLAFEGRAVAPGDEPDIAHRPATPGYFETMAIPVLKGRDIMPGDREDAPVVALVNETMARRYWPGSDPVGRRVRWAREEEPRWMTIVGIVGDVRHFGLGEPEEPALYSAHAQSPFAWRRQMTLTVRTAVDPLALVPQVEREVWSVDRDIPLTGIRAMEQILSESLRQLRLQAMLLGIFAGIALTLACIGIYGVMSYVVTQRTHEIGVRMALGAGAGEVIREAAAQGVKLALAGISIGLLVAFGLSRALSGMLYGVGTSDPRTFALAALVFVAVASVASYLPARRAARVDPAVALRHE